MRIIFALCMCFPGMLATAYGKRDMRYSVSQVRPDTTTRDSTRRSAKPGAPATARFTDINLKEKRPVLTFPASSLQQLLKGEVAGLYAQEQSGEPGTVQNIFIRGTSVPLLSAKDLFRSQPLVVIDGIPVISQDHPFAYDIQQYDFNRIGPATNLLAGIDPENIASIEVVKDIAEASRYGVRAANGVILIKTKKPSVKRQVTFGTYFGLAVPDGVTTQNGASERTFRQKFYDRYATAEQSQNIPGYLRDSLYTIYYGPSNWTDLYYRNALVYGINASITGGVENANFRGSIGSTSTNGTADETGLNRYSASFALMTKPVNWLSITTTVNASQLLRDRNRNLRDRFAEVRYLPDLTNPVSPNKQFYSNYLAQYDKAFDKNKSNVVNGSVDMRFTFGKFNLTSRFATDYSEGYRDIFYPGTLLETNSYVSNYFGYNQRIMIDNAATYGLKWNYTHFLDLEAGQSVQLDSYRYNYGYAYRGTSDYIKINVLNDPITPLTAYFSYQSNLGFLNTLSYRITDQTKNNLLSFYSKGGYRYKDKYSVSVLLRADASSNAQPTSRWLFTPAISAVWNLKSDLLSTASRVSELKLKAGYGRVGRIQQDERFAAGPQYTVDVSYTGEPRLGTYNGGSVLNRPYSLGWVGYNIPWAYSDQLNAGLTIGLLSNRLQTSVDVYSRTDNNEIIGIPAYADYGYALSYEPGLKVNNSGIDVEFKADVFQKNKTLRWTSSFNFNYNRNRLKALPGGMDEIVIGRQLLQVGKAVDQYWVYQNEGIYTSNNAIPVDPKTGNRLSFEGTPMQAGDPKWKDLNGDYVINNNDKILTGNSLPVFSGGMTNNFGYKSWSLGINLYYNLGRNVINQDVANRFDFINQQSGSDIRSVKEITFWEKRGEYDKYPLYNPWSAVTPYRTDQDLFLENASFLKLRHISLSYDLKSVFKKSKVSKMQVYGTASNLFTLTPYTGRDPELADYTGYDTGYGQPIPKTFTLGFKMEL